MDACQHCFLYSLLRQRLHFRHNLRQATAAAGPARNSDDTKGAAVVAAILYFDKSACAGGAVIAILERTLNRRLQKLKRHTVGFKTSQSFWPLQLSAPRFQKQME